MQLFGLDNYFYHGSIRRYIALFGSIFSDIHIKRTSADGKKEDIIQVPIKYGNGNMYMKAPQDETREEKKVSRILPAMAFEVTSIYKDVQRKTNPMNRIVNSTHNANDQRDFQFNRVPYNLTFNLIIRTKNSDDMVQIAEQIIPAFDGNLSVTIQDTTGVDIEQDIIIVLNELETTDNYDDEMQSRLLEWTLTFELKGYLYKRTLNKYIAKEIDIIGVADGWTDTPLVVTEQPPLTEKQDVLSAFMDAMDILPQTEEKKPVRKRTRKE